MMDSRNVIAGIVTRVLSEKFYDPENELTLAERDAYLAVGLAVVEECAKIACIFCREGMPLEPEEKFLQAAYSYHRRPDQEFWHKCLSVDIRALARAAEGSKP